MMIVKVNLLLLLPFLSFVLFIDDKNISTVRPRPAASFFKKRRTRAENWDRSVDDVCKIQQQN
jgi:hypothetical protein